MDLAVYGFCLAAVGYGSLALKLTLLRDARVHVRRPYLAALVASALWAVVSAVVSAVPVVPELHLVPALLDIARYGLWFSFLLTLIRASGADRRTKVLVHTAGILTVLNLALVSLAPLLSAAVYPARLALFAWLSLPIFGLVVLEQVFRNVSEDFRWHAKPLCLGLGTLLVFDIYLYSGAALFSGFDVDALVMRGFAHALAVPLLFVALGRQFEWTQRFQVSRAAAFHTATLMLVGAYLLFVSAVGYYVREFGGSWGSALQFGLLCAALVGLAILLLSRALRAKVRVFVGKNFFRYHYDYRTEWLRFTEMLTSPRSPREMGERIVRGLANMLNSPSGALWALDQAKTAIVQAAFWEMPRSLERVTLDSPMVKFLLEREWVINLEEYRSHPERYEGLELPSWLVDNLRAWVIVPLIVANELTGFVVLGKPPASLHLNWEERDLLKTAGRQAAGFLAQMQATEALLEVRKFDAFNRMSAFVVHDLKNIVAQLSLMMQNARRLKDNPEFQEDMLATVESSLEKMRRLMLQLREGQAPVGVASGVSLLAILTRLQSSAAVRGRLFELHCDEEVVTRGHEERIERVLGHLIQNAFDATEQGGEVRVTLGRDGSQAQVIVADTGCGMAQEFVHMRLFKPFNTTKQSGMGIGTYESMQYVRELGGSLAVDSELGRGTVVTVLLPRIEARQYSDLELLSAK